MQNARGIDRSASLLATKETELASQIDVQQSEVDGIRVNCRDCGFDAGGWAHDEGAKTRRRLRSDFRRRIHPREKDGDPHAPLGIRPHLYRSAGVRPQRLHDQHS